MRPLDDKYAQYLQDESRLRGRAEFISFPKTEEEARDLIVKCSQLGRFVTVQGSRSGLCGGAVPLGGLVLNCSEMDKPLGLSRDGADFLLTVQPGYLLASLRRDLARRRFDWLDQSWVDQEILKQFQAEQEMFWPPDSTELTASLGGIASADSSGPQSLKYGRASAFIDGLRVIAANGNIYDLRKDAPPPAAFKALNQPKGRVLYLFIGREGWLGFISALTLRLKPKPLATWGIAFFFPSEQYAALFIQEALALKLEALTALDFLGGTALTSAASLKKVAAKLQEVPDPPPDAGAAVYINLSGPDEAALEESAGALMDIAQKNHSDLDSSWALAGDAEMEKLRLWRHAVPEGINARLDAIRLEYPDAVKMATDMSLPGLPFSEAWNYYHNDIKQSGLETVVFAHAGGNHFHINFLPVNAREKDNAVALLNSWYKTARKQQGRLFIEHGVGKLKRQFYADHGDDGEKERLKLLKNCLDPHGLWNPGNFFAESQEL